MARTEERSPYYIRTRSIKPPEQVGVLTGVAKFKLHLKRIFAVDETMSERAMRRYREQSNTFNLGPGAGDNPAPIPGHPTERVKNYQTKLQANWTGRLRANPQDDFISDTQGIQQPWPQGTPVGHPHNRVTNQDKMRPGILGRRLKTYPIADPYGQLLSSTGRHPVSDFVGVAGRTSQGLDYGPPPWRVPLIRRTGLSLMAGPLQFGTMQNASTLAGNLIVVPPKVSNPTQGVRAVSGIRGRVQGGGRSHLPAVFAPREVR